jgi:alpha-ketoglutarate-dependent taurine dioxygenase|tara:strand:- start:425 stop:1180 length:756 start_codon:yes stop_codon:yes gene_type:complete
MQNITNNNQYYFIDEVNKSNWHIGQLSQDVLDGTLGVLIIRNANEDVEALTGLIPIAQDLYGNKVIPVGGDDNTKSNHVWHETAMLWHMDRHYSKDVHPVVGLYCQSAPEGSATTLFCDMQTAYAEAPEELKNKSNIKCWNKVDKYFKQAEYPHHFKDERIKKLYRKTAKAEHDLVKADKTGSWFFFSPAYTELMPSHEVELIEHCFQKKYIYEHEWKKNDMLIYNNLKIAHSRGATATNVKRRHLRFALT